MDGPLTDPRVGLCADCAHARPLTSAKRSTFWRCAHHDADARFPKYPRLPVVECAAFEQGSPAGA